MSTRLLEILANELVKVDTVEYRVRMKVTLSSDFVCILSREYHTRVKLMNVSCECYRSRQVKIHKRIISSER